MTETAYDLEVDTELTGKSVDDMEVETQPNLDVTLQYLLTALGKEILTDIQHGGAHG